MGTLCGSGIAVGIDRSQILLAADFTILPSGTLAVLPAGLLFSCASASRTVQTGTSTVVSGIAADTGLVGRLLDADALGLVVDPGRTNTCPASNVNNALHIVNFATKTVEPGPDGVAGSACILDDADAGNIGFTNCSFAGVIGQHVVASFWWRNVSGNAGVTIGVNYNDGGGGWAAVRPQNATWQRTTQKYTQSIAGGGHVTIPAYTPGAIGAASLALVSKEIGDYPTETHPTAGAALARAGARLYHPRDSAMVSGGRLSLECILRPKGAATEYAIDGANVYLWYRDANNYARIVTATRRLEVVTAGGAAWSPVTALSWNRGDTVRLWVEAGGGVALSVAKYQVNAGAVVTIGTSVAAQAAIPTGSTLDLLCAGTASQLSAHLTRVRAWRTGCRPGWAA